MRCSYIMLQRFLLKIKFIECLYAFPFIFVQYMSIDQGLFNITMTH